MKKPGKSDQPQDYISAEGRARLQAELEELLYGERPKVVNNVAAAAAEGDRSENAEYIYGKKRLREIDRRIEFLSRRLDNTVVVPPPTDIDRVRFLSWVLVEDGRGETRAFRIVGPDETDAKEGLISTNSPVGKALLGKEADETVQVRTPGGTVEYTILEIARTKPAT